MARKFCEVKFRGLLCAATFSMLVEYLMGLSDSIVLGHLVGAEALAGINLLQSPMNVVSFFANLLGTGTAICFALAVGRFDRTRALQLFSQGFYGVLLTGGALMLAFLLGRDAFFTILNVSEAIRVEAVSYWNWFVPCAALEPLAVLLASACYADGDGRTCVCAYVTQLLGNLAASIILTRLMGTAGCALGTVLGNLSAIAVLSTHFLKRANTLSLVRHFSVRDYFHICRASFGDASTRLCWAALFFALNKFTIDRFGSGVLPALSVVIAVLGFSEAFNGVPTAAQPLVGVYAGEHNTVGIRRVMAVAARWSTWEGLGVTALLMACPHLAVQMVGLNDPALVTMASTAVRWTALGLLAWSILSLFNSYYLFIEREALATSLTFLANFILPTVLFPLGGILCGITGVWAALGLAPILSGILFSAFLLLRYGRALFPLLIDRTRDAALFVYDLTLTPEGICALSRTLSERLITHTHAQAIAARVGLLVEEVLMAVKDRNAHTTVMAEVTLDLNTGIAVILRDDGEIFDITDADQRISSLRTYLVAALMEHQKNRRNLTTTGFNRNIFQFAQENK